MTAVPSTDPVDLAGSATEEVLAALDRSCHEAARGRRPPSRLVQGPPDRIWSVVTGRLFGGARSEYLGFDDPQALVNAGMTDRMFTAGAAAMDGMVDRGVRIRQVTTTAGARLGDDQPAIPWNRGGDARIVAALPFKACVIDRKIAMLPVDLAFLHAGMLVVSDPVVVATIVAAHRSMWTSGQAPQRSAEQVPVHLRAILQSLARGVTDPVGARQCGLSLRTYQRRVTELVGLLDATSRFEAGAHAARRGWL